MIYLYFFVFFFSSRRRHTRSLRDWSSDVCSSDLDGGGATFAQQYGIPINVAPPPSSGVTPTFLYNSESDHPTEGYPIDQNTFIERSEERRVGKECRSRWWPDH